MRASRSIASSLVLLWFVTVWVLLLMWMIDDYALPIAVWCCFMPTLAMSVTFDKDLPKTYRPSWGAGLRVLAISLLGAVLFGVLFSGQVATTTAMFSGIPVGAALFFTGLLVDLSLYVEHAAAC